MRPERDIDRAFNEKQCRSLQMLRSVQHHDTVRAAVAQSRNLRGNGGRRVELLRSAARVERMQTVDVFAAFECGCHNIKSPGQIIDHRSTQDPVFRG